jgi:xylulokinase
MTGAALGIDVGLSGARAALVAADGRVVARARPWKDGDGADATTDDAAAWFGEVAESVIAILADVDAPRPEVITVTGAGCRPVLVDADLRPLLPARLAAHDTRPAAQRARLAPALGISLGELADHALPTVLWWQENEPQAVAQAAWVLDTAGLLAGWLTGEPVMDRITAADYWLPGIDPPVPVPEPRDPLAVAGTLTPEAAHALALAPGIPVIVGTYDSYVDLHVLAGSDTDEGCILLGTTMVIATDTDMTDADAGQLRVVDLPGGRRVLAGWTSAAGASIEWSADRFRAPGSPDLDPGAGGLLVLPYLDGERTPVWDAAARGAILGVTTATTSAQLERAVLDGVALSARDIVERMRSLGHSPARWRAGGGGALLDDWLQATSDVLDATVEAVDITGGVAAALFGLRAIGGEAAVPVVATAEPDARRTRRFDQLYELYRDLYPRLAPTLHALGNLDDRHH